MKKKLLWFMYLIIGIVILTKAASIPFTYIKKVSLIDKVMKLVEENFVPVSDTQEVNETQLVYGAIEGMLKTLNDPYTRFMPPESFKEMQEETTGTFGGVGIIITNKDGKLMVVSPIEGTPAWRAGILPGDIIYKINGELSETMHTIDATKKIKGPIGTEVTLTIMRIGKDGKKKFIDMKIKRSNIKVSTISQSGVMDKHRHIGYIRISNFGERTGKEFKKELHKLISKAKIDALILDLRSNPGGLLTAAVETASALLPKGDIVVSIRGKHGEEVKYPVYKDGVTNLPLVVLVNKGSASGSEIVAGALKDLKRGILLGTKTFGKGIVQTVIPLGDGSAVAITTAKYYTPSGVCIHGKGIEPDIYCELPEPDEKMLKELEREREKNFKKEGEKIFEREQGKIINVEIGKYDTQLKEAVRIIEGGRMLYGDAKKIK
jgi:carboxyl-terminal processing protease